MKRKIRNTVAAFLAAVVTAPGVLAQSMSDAYVLGAGDQLQFRVVAWNDEARRFEEFPFFDGQYAIQSDGFALIPLAGPIAAAGKTRFDLAGDVAEALRRNAGLVDEPSVSVEIVSFRPFYVVGDVGSPGEYEMRPGLTVAQAHALSGGQGVLGDSRLAALTVFRDTGALVQAEGEIARARIRIARLEAERDEAAEVIFPKDNTHPDGPTALRQIEAEEKSIFASRALSLELEISSLEELKDLLLNEIASLEQKLDGQQNQTVLARQNLRNVELLVERGVSRSAALIEAQRGLFDLESKELDLEDGIFRARQRINEADRDITALRNGHLTGVNQQLQNAKSEQERLEIRAQTLRRLIAENEAATIALDDSEIMTEYRITRLRDGSVETFVAKPSDRIAPGDVLSIENVTLAQ